MAFFSECKAQAQPTWQAGSGTVFTNRSVGIGTTTVSPSNKLQVVGNIAGTSISANSAVIDGLTLQLNSITSSTGTLSFGNNILNNINNLLATQATIDGITIRTNQILSSTGNLSFDG